MTRPDWFLDWEGGSCAIIASGPTAKKANIAVLRGVMPVIAIKENIELCPWADVVYGCDAAWWKNSQGLPKYAGLKVAFEKTLKPQFPDIKFVDIAAQKKIDRILTVMPGTLGSGGNSGFQAVNLAVQFGAKRILLIGFDMHDRGGVHWYGRAGGMGRSNPNEENFRRWRAAFHASMPDFESAGVEVVNATPFSSLTCFKKSTIEAALQDWGLQDAA